MPEWERFPTDEVSLTMLEAACNINPDTGYTELGRFLEMTGGGVVSVTIDGAEDVVFPNEEAALEEWGFPGDPPVLYVEHEKPPHSANTVIISLIEEICRLRTSNTEKAAE